LTDSGISAYDSAVHISEECSNAAVAVPKAIVGAIALAGVLGTAIMIALAFCMGTDLEAIMGSSVGQPVSSSIVAWSRVFDPEINADGGHLLSEFRT
jgi:amino acid transporter